VVCDTDSFAACVAARNQKGRKTDAPCGHARRARAGCSDTGGARPCRRRARWRAGTMACEGTKARTRGCEGAKARGREGARVRRHGVCRHAGANTRGCISAQARGRERRRAGARTARARARAARARRRDGAQAPGRASARARRRAGERGRTGARVGDRRRRRWGARCTATHTWLRRTWLPTPVRCGSVFTNEKRRPTVKSSLLSCSTPLVPGLKSTLELHHRWAAPFLNA
jgi:hypothetical protein